MPSICKGVDFDTVAREWRCKWSEANDKKSLEEVQTALLEVMPKVSAVKGVKGVQRIVCGGCHDFKVITSLPADKFGEWEGAGFEPENEFLEAIKKIDGVSSVETQTFTNMPMKVTPPRPPPKLKKAKTWQIGRLNPDSKGFTVEAKVLDEPKEVDSKGAGKLFEVTVGDKSGKVVASLKDFQVDSIKGQTTVVFRNARVIMVNGHVRIVVDKWGKVDACETEIETVGDKNVSATEFELVKA